MFYRACPDLTPPADADLDDPATVEAAAAVEQGERDLAMLSRLADIGMDLAESLGAYARARLAAATAEGNSLGPTEDPTAPFNRIAQTVRRTLALRAKLARDLRTGRTELHTDRAARRAKADEDHRAAKRAAIERGFKDALAEDHPDRDDATSECLLMDMDELLADADEFRDFLDRPVGETIARLCATLGLDPALCVTDGAAWKVRRDPFLHEPDAMEPAGLPPSPSWGGTGCAASRVGNPGLSDDPDNPKQPHPDAFSVCPSP